MNLIYKLKKLFLLLHSSDYFIFIILFIITFASRLFIVNGEYHGYGWDPGNFALATESYSIQHTRPHWPGYFLHVKIMQILNYFFQDTFKTMIILSIFYSSLGISFFYFVLKNWFQKKESFFLSLILMSNPMIWYYGCVEEMYSFELFFSTLLIFLSKKDKLIYLTPLLMGIGAGIRPSSAVLLFPLYIYLWYSFYKDKDPELKHIILFHFGGLIALLSWILPLSNTIGGVWAYITMFQTHSPIQKITFSQNILQFIIYLTYPTFGILLGFSFIKIQKLTRKSRINTNQIIDNYLSIKDLKKILKFWLIPPMLFFILIHYSKGTLLLCIAGIISILPIIFLQKDLRFKFYTVLIIIQFSFYFFADYKLPNVQTYFNRSERDINISEVIKERLGSNYLFCKSNIENMQKEFNILKEIIKNFENDKTEMYFSKKYIFIDPTTSISPRALQAQYPNISFAKISPRMHSKYEILHDLNLQRKDTLQNALSNSIIFSRQEFVDIYLINVEMKRINFDFWTLFIPHSKDLKLLEDIYTKYFYR